MFLMLCEKQGGLHLFCHQENKRKKICNVDFYYFFSATVKSIKDVNSVFEIAVNCI